VVTILASCLLPAAYYARPPRRCSQNLTYISVALHTYHDVYHSLPPAYLTDASGKPIHSWRVLLLPFLDQVELYEKYRFDEPWDGPHNRLLHDEIVSAYCCQEQRARSTGKAATDTTYVVVVGPQTAFPGDRCISLGDIRDGTSNTVLVVEVKNSGIHWVEPRDLHVTQMNPCINPPRGQGISSLHKGYANAAMADGGVKTLSEQLSPREVAGLLTIDGGEPMPTPEQ
jgi:prepilin-type processing-associated H-X9-DG protein